MILKNKKAIVTGASQGLGRAIAEHYILNGASVMICARNAGELEQTWTELSKMVVLEGQKVDWKVCDVANIESIDSFCKETLGSLGDLDILVNNAGIYGPFGPIEEVAWQEWVEAININLMGTVYFCRALVPHFKKRKYGKIINLSGGGATNPMPRVSSYAAAKAAVVRFTETLALELKEFGIDVNAVAPGALTTRLTDQLLAAGAQKVGKDFFDKMQKIKNEGGAPLEKGADLCVYLASSDSDGLSGKLISAIWDPWPFKPEDITNLSSSETYTLRRITPNQK